MTFPDPTDELDRIIAAIPAAPSHLPELRYLLNLLPSPSPLILPGLRSSQVQTPADQQNALLNSGQADGSGSALAESFGSLPAVGVEEALADAGAAAAAAALALADLANIASDSLLTPDEKPRVILDRDTITAEQAGIDGQATAYGIGATKTAYDNAVTALVAYLATLTAPVLWSDLAGNTTIVGADFRTAFSTVYATRQALLDAIYAAAKTLADNAQSTATAAGIAAAAAQGTANTALASANGKNVITHSLSAASGSGVTVGDLWFQYNGSAQLIGQWRWSGAAWIAETIANALIANLDAAKITTGYLDVANRIQAGSITTAMLNLLDAYGQTVLSAAGFGQAWADFIWAGIYNPVFQKAVAVNPLPDGRTSYLGYWTVSHTGTANRAKVVADATNVYSGGFYVEFSPAAANEVLSLTSDLVPLIPGGVIVPATVLDVSLADANAKFDLALYYYKADGTTPASVAYEEYIAPVSATQTWMGIDIGTGNGNCQFSPPGDARYVKLAVTVFESVHSAGRWFRIGGGRLIPGIDQAAVYPSGVGTTPQQTIYALIVKAINSYADPVLLQGLFQVAAAGGDLHPETAGWKLNGDGTATGLWSYVPLVGYADPISAGTFAGTDTVLQVVEITAVPAGVKAVQVELIVASSTAHTGNAVCVMDYAATTNSSAQLAMIGYSAPVAAYYQTAGPSIIKTGGTNNRQVKYWRIFNGGGTVTWYLRVVGYWV